jgi:quercetin dioxygenase-like cupin family protein
VKLFRTMATVAAVLPFTLSEGAPTDAAQNVEISRSDSRTVAQGPGVVFIGEVSVKSLFGPNGVRNTAAAEVGFTPCARTAWHTHPAGQTLIVTAGTGWIQEWGGLKQRIHPGDVIWTPPGVKHWHGATDTTAMTHVAIQDFVDGRPVDWMEHVTDEDYLG